MGKGTAVNLGAQASLNCWRPGNDATEKLIVRHTLGRYEPPYACEGVLAYRLSAPTADHYFLVNDGPAKSVVLDTKDYCYRSAADAVTGQKLPLGAPIEVEARGGRWVRMAK